MNLFLLSETSFLWMIFFLFFFFYICVFASSIVKSEHSVWPWLSHMIVIWSPVDWGASGVLDVQSVCDPRVFLFDGCLLFPRPLSSTLSHVPLFLLTTLFQPSSWSKGEIKLALFIDGRLKSENGSHGNFFSPKKRKKIYLASPVSRPPHWVIHTINSPGYFGSSPQRLLFKRHQHFPFISPTVGSVLGRGSLFSISLRSFQWSVTYTCKKKKTSMLLTIKQRRTPSRNEMKLAGRNEKSYQLETHLLSPFPAVGGTGVCADKDRALQHREQPVKETAPWWRWTQRSFFFLLLLTPFLALRSLSVVWFFLLCSYWLRFLLLMESGKQNGKSVESLRQTNKEQKKKILMRRDTEA